MNKTSIVSQLNRLDIDRLRGYRELLDFYHGRQWEGRERRGEKRLTFNYAKVFIDKVTSYLMSGINFAVEAVGDSEEDKTKAQRAEAALHQVYEDNNLEQLDLETEIDCAILGDACYKVIWDQEMRQVRSRRRVSSHRLDDWLARKLGPGLPRGAYLARMQRVPSHDRLGLDVAWQEERHLVFGRLAEGDIVE